LRQAVLNAIPALIVEAKQMLGVPDGSILLVEIQDGVRVLRWEDGFLAGRLRADGMPMTPTG
jgi:hypothetical protein